MLAELSLQLGDYGIIGGMVAGALSIPTTLIVFNLRSLGERVGRVESGKADLDHVQRVESRVAEVEKTKVATNDWLRVVASQTNRQNRMSEQLATIEGKLDANLGIGGQLRRIAEAVEKRPEESHGSP